MTSFENRFEKFDLNYLMVFLMFTYTGSLMNSFANNTSHIDPISHIF